MATYPNEEFQGIYESILNSMGSDDDLRAKLEAALRPMYEQSKAELERQRLAGNAAIDVDAASRGMGNSTWVTDAKLQNLRNAENGLASLGANYNNTLFTNLLNAIQDRDDKAYQQAMQWWQNSQSGRGGKGEEEYGIEDSFEKWKQKINEETVGGNPRLGQPTIKFGGRVNVGH